MACLVPQVVFYDVPYGAVVLKWRLPEWWGWRLMPVITLLHQRKMIMWHYVLPETGPPMLVVVSRLFFPFLICVVPALCGLLALVLSRQFLSM